MDSSAARQTKERDMRDDLRELYQDLILDHARAPRNFRTLAKADREAMGANPMCGDRLTIALALGADGRIADASFVGKGCAISMASASLMTELVRGRTQAEAHTLFTAFHDMCTSDHATLAPEIDEDTRDRLTALSGVRGFPMRVKCATLAWHALEAALRDEKQISTE